MQPRIVILAFLIALSGCQSPCIEGFARSNDGMCDEIINAQEDEPPNDVTQDALDSAEPDLGEEGQGSITIKATALDGWQYHAYVLQAYPEDKHFAEAAMCVIMLNDPHVVNGQLMDWNAIYEYQTVCSVDSPDAQVHTFSAGPVTLRSFIYAGEGASPSACGEITVMVDGDIEIEAPEVGDCP